MNHPDITDGRFRIQMQIFYFQIINPITIDTNQQYRWEQDFQGVSFMKTDEYFEEIFCVVSAHTKNFR